MQDKAERSKQFLMFDSLKGFKQCLKQKERIIVHPKFLMEDALEELDYQIKQLQTGMVVTIIYLDRGQYIKVTGMVSTIDLDYKKTIQIVRKVIPIQNIVQIEV